MMIYFFCQCKDAVISSHSRIGTIYALEILEISIDLTFGSSRVMSLFSTEEYRLIALRTLQLTKDKEETLLILETQLNAGSNELVGYMGEYYKLYIKLKHSGIATQQSLQYFVKSIPHKNPPQKAECERKGFFRKETTIYTEILSNLQRYSKLFLLII